MRILLGLTEVSGFFARLKQGFDELGVEAVHISLQSHRFSYSGEAKMPRIVVWARYCVGKRLAAAQSSALWRAFWFMAVIVTRLLLLAWALARFDVFILGAGSSFFSFRELPLLRLLGKKVIYTLHGTDARPPYIDGFFDPSQYDLPVNTIHDLTLETPRERAERFALAHTAIARRRRQQVQAIERNATAVLCGPSYSHFLTKPFVNFYAVGIPTSASQWNQISSKTPLEQGRVRILHAPSELRGKGTHEIRNAIATLQIRALPIDYIEISGRPNVEVMTEITRCDLVIDQLYSDTPMAGFAAEAGLLGIPAVVGGYYSASVRDHVPADQMPPTAFCHPDKLVSVVTALVVDPVARAQLGAAAQRHVTEQWGPKDVAERFLRILDEVPPDWLIDPRQVTYLNGIGLSEEQARANVAAMISRGGVASLQLQHRPDLEYMFETFAKGAR